MNALIVFVALAVVGANAGGLIGAPLTAPLATSVISTRTIAAPGLIGAPAIASPLIGTRSLIGAPGLIGAPALAAPLGTGLIGARTIIGGPAISTLSAAPLAAW